MSSNWKTFIIVICLSLLAFIPRLYRISNPVADWHSWRQADTAAVTRNFIKEGFTPLFPKFDSYYALSQTDKPNPERYFFAEFPIYNILTYPFYWYLGVDERYARLVNVIISTIGTIFLYFLVRQFLSERAALISAIFYAILPFNIYYGRVILGDPLHITLTIVSLYLIAKWTQIKDTLENYFLPKEWALSFLAGISVTGMLLTKPYGLVLGLPILYLLLKKFGLPLFKRPSLYLFLITALLPFAAWRWHIYQYPEGMFGTDWLYNSTNIRFTGAYFRWLIFERMNRLIFATGGFVLFFFGIVRARNKIEGWFFYLWLLAIGVFFGVIATGNVTHDYYQLPLVPIGCIFMAKGYEFLLMFGKGLKHRIVNFILANILVILMLAFGWYEVRGYFNINHWGIVYAGKAVDLLLPKDAKVIAPYQRDSAFLYQTNRYGWTLGDVVLGDGLIEKFIADGATHYVSINFDDVTNDLINRCDVVQKTTEYVIIDVRQCKPREIPLKKGAEPTPEEEKVTL